jgi:hypothetical protein
MDNLNPISIRVKDKSHVPHPPIRDAFLPVYFEVLQTLASRIQIIHCHT